MTDAVIDLHLSAQASPSFAGGGNAAGASPILEQARQQAAADNLPYAGSVTPRDAWALFQSGEAVLVNAPETVQEKLLHGFESLDEPRQQTLADSLESWLASSGLDDVAPALFFEQSSSTA